ncbi:hypothetical protein PQ459_09860 [Chryseobacterium sp. KACC 21268]|nr:hypothetical protein PQ459_09860 [Chryseobacterium sp. KACC 21268]
MKRIITILLLISTLNSCFLAITGAPHQHSYKEVNNKDDLKLLVHCMYLNKTFEVHNANTQDSIYIKSSSFKRPNEKLSLNDAKSDSVKYYNWRIGDLKYHKNLPKDVIEITRITKEGNQIDYKFIADIKEK